MSRRLNVARALVLICGLLAAPVVGAAELSFSFTGVSTDLRTLLQNAMPPVRLNTPPDIADARMAAFLRLRQTLEAYGYFDARWQEQVAKRDDNYILTFALRPGPRVLVRKVTLRVLGAGRGLPALRHILGKFPLRRGQALNQPLYEDWKAGVLETLHADGYAMAAFSRHEILVDRNHHWADIFLTVDSGDRYQFGQVTFSGAKIYSRSFLSRYLYFRPGDWYSPVRLAQTQANLRNADRFSEIAVRADLQHAANDRIPVQVQLRALRPKRLKLGAGYSSDLGANLALGYDDYNALRRGEHAHVLMTLAQRVLDVSTSYIWPVGNRFGAQYVAQLNYQHLNLIPYSAGVFDTGFGRDWAVGSGATLGAFLSYQKIIYTINGVSGQSRVTMPSLRYSAQNFANPVRPFEGDSWSAVIQGGARMLIGDANFMQVRAHGVWRRRLGARWVVGLRAEAGATWLSGPIDNLSPTLRFFAGGEGTLPGYAYLSQGPSQNGVVLGGRSLLVGGVDLERLVARNWGIVAFYHAGNALNSFAAFRVLRDMGVGVRWYSPFGPVRLDIAHPLVAPTVPYLRVVFSVGVSL